MPTDAEYEAQRQQIADLSRRLEVEEARSKELEAGITRMAGYLGVLHVLKG